MISYSGNIPELVKKEKYLQNTPVYIDHTDFNAIYSDTLGIGALYQHSFVEISYVEKGYGYHRIWNESYPIESGDVFIMNVAVPHGFFSISEQEPLTVRRLFFDPHDLYNDEILEIGGERYLFGLFARDNFSLHLSLKGKQYRKISQKFDEIQLEVKERQCDWIDAVRAQITLLLLYLKRMEQCSSSDQIHKETKVAATVSSVLKLVQEHYADPTFSLKTISEILHKSTSSISRSFFEVTGKYFSEYLIYFRMQQATYFLTETELSNEEIALRCGYCDFPSFYKQFHQVIGTTPGEFRKKNDELLQSINMEDTNKQFYLDEISQKLQKSKADAFVELIHSALNEGIPPDEIIYKGLLGGMTEIGKKFQSNEVFLAEVMRAAKNMHTVMEILKPYLVENNFKPIGCAVICTVKGDLHDLGKNLVKVMLEGEQIHCIDLGVDVDPLAVVEAVKEHNAQLVCLSALLTTTMMAQKDVIDALKAAGLRDRVRVMVGGVPITQQFAEEIGADCYTADAGAAAKEARRLLMEMKAGSSSAE